MMDIQFVTQHIYFVFKVNEQYYRIIFERDKQEAPWAVRLIDVSNKSNNKKTRKCEF